jgi:hypothetical protein
MFARSLPMSLAALVCVAVTLAGAGAEAATITVSNGEQLRSALSSAQGEDVAPDQHPPRVLQLEERFLTTYA